MPGIIAYEGGGVTIDELLDELKREHPNGVSFDPMSVRLLRKKIPLHDGQIEELKEEMFQMGDELWFTREMISDDESRLALREQATKWLMEYGCFSVERLFERFCGTLRHIATPEYFATYLRHLGFTVTAWRKYGLFCFPPSRSLSECMAAIAKVIAERIEEVGGMLAFSDIEEMLPYLTAEALEGIRAQFLPEVHAAEIGEVPCWRSAEAIHLPEDFSIRLSHVIDKLMRIGQEITIGNLMLALDWEYDCKFTEEFDLHDRGVFWNICKKTYKRVWPELGSNKSKKLKACVGESNITLQNLIRSENLDTFQMLKHQKYYPLALAALEAAKAHLTHKCFSNVFRSAGLPIASASLSAALKAARKGMTVDEVALEAEAAAQVTAIKAREKDGVQGDSPNGYNK